MEGTTGPSSHRLAAHQASTAAARPMAAHQPPMAAGPGPRLAGARTRRESLRVGRRRAGMRMAKRPRDEDVKTIMVTGGSGLVGKANGAKCL